MKKTLCFLLINAIFLLNTTPLWAQATGGPRMVFKETSHHIGDVEEGVVIEHSFIVSNQGDKPLLIKDVKPG